MGSGNVAARLGSFRRSMTGRLNKKKIMKYKIIRADGATGQMSVWAPYGWNDVSSMEQIADSEWCMETIQLVIELSKSMMVDHKNGKYYVYTIIPYDDDKAVGTIKGGPSSEVVAR
jgi:hypothetical protein